MHIREKILYLNQYKQNDGSLVSIQPYVDIPFEIKRIFYIYDVPNNSSRANHASLTSEFVFIALKGNISIQLDNGIKKEKYILDEPNIALYIPKLTWIKAEDFSESAILMVIASYEYENSGYISNYNEFINVTTNSGVDTMSNIYNGDEKC